MFEKKWGGGGGAKPCICGRKPTVSRGVWGHAPPGNFCFLDSLRWHLVCFLALFLKIAIESPTELTDSHVEEVIDIWSRKSRRITV